MTPYYAHDGITIYHADCFDVLPALHGIGAVVTDPPYSSGGAFRGDRMATTMTKYLRSDSDFHRTGTGFTGDNRDQRSFAAWCALWMTAARAAAEVGATIACFIDWRQLPTLTDAIQAGGWVWRGVGVWSKGYGRPRLGGFSGACEFLVWGSHGPLTVTDAAPAGVCDCPIAGVDREHLTAKPEPVVAWAMGNVPPGALVLDPFMGAGSTLAVCRRLGLPAIGIEIEERYCEMAARRLAQERLVFDPVVEPGRLEFEGDPA